MGDTAPVLDRLAVVVVNYGSHEMVEANLDQLDREVTVVDFVIVDSFSTDHEQTAMREVCRRRGWTFVPTGENRGFGSAANAGAARAIERGRDVLLLLNPDARIDADGLVLLATEVSHRPDRMVAPIVLRSDRSVWFDGAVTDRRTGRPGRVPNDGDGIPWLTGACLGLSADLWQRLAGFDDDYFMYWEDVDLSYRCRSLGADLAVVDTVEVIHDVGGTQAGGKSPLYVRYCCRNRLLFASKNLGRRELLRWILWTPKSSWLIARRAARRPELIRSPRLLRAMLAGTFAGLGHALPALFKNR